MVKKLGHNFEKAQYGFEQSPEEAQKFDGAYIRGFDRQCVRVLTPDDEEAYYLFLDPKNGNQCLKLTNSDSPSAAGTLETLHVIRIALNHLCNDQDFNNKCGPKLKALARKFGVSANAAEPTQKPTLQ